MNLSEERIAKFKEVVLKMEGCVTILIAQPDPDAIAAARTIAWVISKLRPQNGIEIRTYYGGEISHPQNQALVGRLDVTKLRPINALDQSNIKNVILVDSSSVGDARLPGVKIDPVMVIDHHRNSVQEKEFTFVWIEDMGSVSTLMVELVLSLGMQFDESNQTIATLLSLGIHTDTHSLTTCHDRDLDAYTVVAKVAPKEELASLFTYALPATYFRNLKRALTNEVMHGGVLVSHIGHITAVEGDDISTIADDFIRRIGVTVVLVWGIIGRVVRLSARSADRTRPLELFLQETFPGISSGAKRSPDGRGIGGAMFDLEIAGWMTTADTVNEVEALVSKSIQSRVFKPI